MGQIGHARRFQVRRAILDSQVSAHRSSSVRV
jgi:hypothetical protein